MRLFFLNTALSLLSCLGATLGFPTPAWPESLLPLSTSAEWPPADPPRDPRLFRPDNQIRTDLLVALASDPGIDPFNYHPEVRGGRIELKGRTNNPEESARLERLARRLPGVKGVDNEVEVPGGTDLPDSGVARGVLPNLAYPAQLAHPEPGSQAAGRSFASRSLGPSASESPGASQKGFAIREGWEKDGLLLRFPEVRIQGGTAVLHGQVRYLLDRIRAQKIALRTPGIQAVRNQLEVEAVPFQTDLKLRRIVEKVLADPEFESRPPLALSVINGAVTLTVRTVREAAVDWQLLAQIRGVRAILIRYG